MKIQVITICGEADHPLLDQFVKHYAEFNPYIQFGVTDKWLRVNGDTSSLGNIFHEKVEQQNEALRHIGQDVDYVFTFDVDEFLSRADIDGLVGIVESERPDVCLLQANNFWHSEGYIGVGGDGWAYESWNPRVWRFAKGMQFVSHRPPVPNYTVTKEIAAPMRFNHYSYVYEEHIRRKLLYYNLIYPTFNYMEWFNQVWKRWTIDNRDEIESAYSIHPSCKNAKTELFTGKHEIQWT